ncbi:MAG TPA: peptidylprolyl isomerase [Bryobacteraceae bacterium]|nr:peptidylprolyl isomerase [Bryobacteraceae bacterium]
MRRLSVFLGVASIAALAFGQAQRKPGLYAIFNTSVGVITAQLYEKDTPNTVKNFVGLAMGTQPWLDPETRQVVKRPLYNNITFHRVVSGEMIQSGDPTGKGTHNCGFTIKDEFLPGLRFDRAGRLAMANTGSPDSGGCQFFITVGPMSQWTNKYTIFGQVVEGEEVVEKINHAKAREEKPLDPVKLLSVSIERIGPPPGKKK